LKFYFRLLGLNESGKDLSKYMPVSLSNCHLFMQSVGNDTVSLQHYALFSLDIPSSTIANV
jgi:hypothetical protein